MKLKWTGLDGQRSINGRPLRKGEVFDVPDRDGEYLVTCPCIEAVNAPKPKKPKQAEDK